MKRTLVLGAGLLGGLGVLLRLNNAIRYPPRWGFDAMFNERYVERLLTSLSLPAPDTDWSTAHPPLFYYLSAGIGRVMGTTESLDVVVPTRLLGTLAGLVMVWLAFRLVAERDPDRPRRAWLAGALVLFLPVHIYMSAMLNEEILAASFTSLALAGAVFTVAHWGDPERATRRDVAIGFVAGLALLTKLTGVLVIAAAAAAYLWVGVREKQIPLALRRAAVVCGIAALVGGWFYARNLALYGYIYPQDLETHALMFSMPPGERHMSDYFRIPLATFTDPQVLNPDLLRSIWGTTYLSAWFEGHGHFLPPSDPLVKRMGAALLLLGLLPTVAFCVGVVRGFRRAFNDPRAPEAALLLLTGGTLFGYVVFTASNPMFATVKASYLLGISLPFAYFASDSLIRWTERGGAWGALVWALLGVLLVGVCATFAYGIGLWNLTPPGVMPGLQWQAS